MKKLLIGLITWYQTHVSVHTPSRCRFIPTCSQYAKQAIEVHGAAKGMLLAVWRILRCNPWGGQGYDPVPEKHKWR